MGERGVSPRSTVQHVPEASVILSVRDEEPEFLRRAIDSVLGQSFEDFELIVVDDGSSKRETLEELAFTEQRDPRTRVLRLEHCGLTKALNVGIQIARGHTLFRHDSDDWSEPSRFTEQVRAIREQSDLVLIGSAVALHREDGRFLWNTQLPIGDEEIGRAFPSRNPFCHGAVCMRTDAVRRIGAYDEGLTVSQDYDLFWRLSKCGRVANLDRVLYHLRRTAHSITTRMGAHQATATREIRLRHGNAKSRTQPRPSSAADQEQGTGDQLLLAGHLRRAFLSYLRAARIHPVDYRIYGRIVRAFAFVLFPPTRRRLFERTWH
jgi:glycosyltransferase involved in cell wall biosynthesis